MNESGTSILLLIGSSGKLLRTITDGDIRRLLLSDVDLHDTLEQLAPSEAIVVNASAGADEVLALMDQHGINQVPVLDEQGKAVAIHLRRELQPRIQLSIPHMGKHERQYVEEAFQTNWIAPLGPNVDAFEREVAEYVGSGHAAALSSGTSAIHLALRLLDVGRDDVVLCSSFTFVASSNPILYQGATPIFVDSEPDTWNMSPEALEAAVQSCIRKGIRPKAILVVHLYGQSARMDRIMSISEEYDIPVVEDAAESLGGFYKGKHTGTIGKFGVFSFNGNKIITTSGGGMLISDDKTFIEKARFLSTQAREPAPYYEHAEVGYNYRMSNVLAGIGRGQLKVLDERVKSRRNIFLNYRESLSQLECIDWMPEPAGDFSNRWLSAMSLNPTKTNVTPQELIEQLSLRNIEARHVWKPMHRQPLFSKSAYFEYQQGKSFCDYLFETSICLPSASNMSSEQQGFVINSILDVLG